jgi:hypothetical protein
MRLSREKERGAAMRITNPLLVPTETQNLVVEELTKIRENPWEGQGKRKIRRIGSHLLFSLGVGGDQGNGELLLPTGVL